MHNVGQHTGQPFMQPRSENDLLQIMMMMTTKTMMMMMIMIMKELGIDNSTQKAIIEKIMNIAVRCTYYVFCRRNKAWANPELLNLDLSCFFRPLSSILLLSSFSSVFIRSVIVCYFNIIVLFSLYADMSIIHCLLISEMYSCNF